jgi:hypothetical protein
VYKRGNRIGVAMQCNKRNIMFFILFSKQVQRVSTDPLDEAAGGIRPALQRRVQLRWRLIGWLLVEVSNQGRVAGKPPAVFEVRRKYHAL